MPTEAENIQYLYLILTDGGPPSIDWESICKKFSLTQGAASKRWSRLKLAMDAGDKPAANSYDFLWTLAMHSKRSKALDWNRIAEKCDTTPGAASKRYSRMKLAWENSEDKEDGQDTAPTSAPKRKRGSAAASTLGSSKKKAGVRKHDAGDYEAEDSEDPYGGVKTPKRARTSAKAFNTLGSAKKKAGASKGKLSGGEVDDEKHIDVKQTPKRAGTKAITKKELVKAEGTESRVKAEATVIKIEAAIKAEDTVAKVKPFVNSEKEDEFFSASEGDKSEELDVEEDAVAQERVEGWLGEVTPKWGNDDATNDEDYI